MKRFYKDVTTRGAGDGREILLDGRPIKTPARNALAVPGERLALAIADEWAVQGETIDPRSMPLTGLANAAIDRVAPEAQAFAASLGIYGESDLLCYRAEGPETLARRQAEAWDPVLEWAKTRFGIDFTLACGVMHRPQPEATLERLRHALAEKTPFELAGLSPLVTIGGSLVLALALAEGAVDLDTAWAAATVDERYQAEQWGEDSEAAAALDARRRDFAAGYRFLNLL